MPTFQEAQEVIKRKLSPGEQFIEAVAGPITGEAFTSIVVLASNGIKIITPSGTTSIPTSNLVAVSWAPAWARLNIDLKSPRRRIVIAIYGPEWKIRARSFAEAARKHVQR